MYLGMCLVRDPSDLPHSCDHQSLVCRYLALRHARLKAPAIIHLQLPPSSVPALPQISTTLCSLHVYTFSAFLNLCNTDGMFAAGARHSRCCSLAFGARLGTSRKHNNGSDLLYAEIRPDSITTASIALFWYWQSLQQS